jgi:hypothetical protein
MTWIPTPLMSGDAIYRNFQDGPGPERLATSAAIVDGLVGRYQERTDRILRLRARMEAAWQGTAADAADRGLGPVVIEHGLAGRALHVAQDLTSRQVGSFGEAKNAVVPVPPAPGEVDVLAMFMDQDVARSYFMQVAQHNQAAQHNVDVMNGYTGASQYNADGQPTSYGQLTDDRTGIGIDTGTSGDEKVAGSDVDARAQDVPAPGADSVGNGSSVRSAAESGSGPTWTPSAESTRPADAGPTRLATMPAGLGIPVTGDAAPDGGARGGGANGSVANGGGGSGAGGGGAGGGVLPRGGGPVGGPWRGLPGGGSGAGSTPPGTAARPMVISAGPGRGGVGFAGLPAPAGRGRGEEDTERTAPAYLDGGDPDELWDTDELTVPPAIGNEDG